MLNAAGNVIQIGMEIKGMILNTFANFLNDELLPEVFVLITLSIENRPPIIGKIPVGSGELRSLNQSMPSVKIAGLIL